MNKVEDLSRQVCQQVIVKTEGSKRMQPRMNAAQKPATVSKTTTKSSEELDSPRRMTNEDVNENKIYKRWN